MSEILYFFMDIVIGGGVIWIASKITSVDLYLKETIIAVTVAALVSFMPGIGWPLSFIALFYLLKRFSHADVWPDLIFMVVVSRLLAIIAVGFINTS